MNDKIEKNNLIIKRIKKLELVGLTRKTFNSNYETMIIL